LALVVFDLDETLIGIDSDHAWGEYIVDAKIVDAADHRHKNQAFYEDYKRGELDIDAYMQFSCGVLASHDEAFLVAHRETFVNERIRPHLLPKAATLIQKHRDAGDLIVVVTATIEFVTAPIVKLLGIEHLVAPVPEKVDGQYTGELSGIASFGAGKVTRLKQWLLKNPASMQGSYFYSDSINDLPLLNVVDHPFAVDPDEQLRKLATQNQWPIISLRD
jgi:HAD superfamily hydrolase (TIGR01490 family)